MKRYRNLVMDSARWEGFEFRDDDIVISTPPKCGTTWTQMICALLIFQDPELPSPLTELSPWVDVQTRSVDKVFASLAAQDRRRFIKTHTPFDGIPDDDRVTYICVGRDPRDVGISWDNHMGNLNIENFINARAGAVGLDDLAELMPDGMPQPPEDPKERFWSWIDNDGDTVSGLPAMLHHVGTFWDRRSDGNVVMLHYSDMKADLEGVMRALAMRLDIEVPEERWPVLVEAAGFDRMKERAEVLAPQVTDKFWNETGHFFRNGTSGQWRSFFTDDDEARYRARVEALASADLVEWVHNGSKRAVK